VVIIKIVILLTHSAIKILGTLPTIWYSITNR